ncbi:unnamed protein product [Candidula unifasciata]|uniref:Uncharacterized protein n=1 Tax=Candidula unifasciata TaxID=100452 RepID=A0A8S3YYF5_9EUPU|nr:unnamed protein product [Candidula unifasciata]
MITQIIIMAILLIYPHNRITPYVTGSSVDVECVIDFSFPSSFFSQILLMVGLVAYPLQDVAEPTPAAPGCCVVSLGKFTSSSLPLLSGFTYDIQFMFICLNT